jgi:hypothetical protein
VSWIGGPPPAALSPQFVRPVRDDMNPAVQHRLRESSHEHYDRKT